MSLRKNMSNEIVLQKESVILEILKKKLKIFNSQGV